MFTKKYLNSTIDTCKKVLFAILLFYFFLQKGVKRSVSKRSEFIEKVTAILDEYQGEDSSVYLFSADYADFKMINHAYGFAQGDVLLNKTVQSVRQIPECVLCERAAMDQFIFVVVVGNSRTEAEIVALCDRWFERFLSAEQDSYPACSLKVWCGIYEIRDRDVSAAVDNANLARREAKATGEQTTVLFKESMLEKLVEQKKRETEVDQALKEGRFAFYLQPQVDLTSGEIVGAEALARGFHPDGQMISPAVFVPIFEKNGLILDLDYLILEQVCRHIRERLDAGKPVIQISINLSRLHLGKRDTAQRIHEIVERYKTPPELLMFELTENILLHEFVSAKTLGSDLHAFGYKTSVDDFGSGYAGIDVWRNLVFDELKLDRSFLTDDPEMKQRNEIIVSGIVGIAQRLNISVICEGVETREQCRSLLEAGCRLAQGFYFSKPLPVDDFYAVYQELHGRYPMDY